MGQKLLISFFFAAGLCLIVGFLGLTIFYITSMFGPAVVPLTLGFGLLWLIMYAVVDYD